MLVEFKKGFLIMLIFTFLLGIAYPFSITFLSSLLFPNKANGSLLTYKGKIIGSELLGQQFKSNKYFHSRPGSTISNIGQTNKIFINQVQSKVNSLNRSSFTVPIDLVTQSASGIDPHISPRAAYSQAFRIAQARGVSEEAIKNIIKKNIENREFGFLGEKRINVLKLNLELEEKF